MNLHEIDTPIDYQLQRIARYLQQDFGARTIRWECRRSPDYPRSHRDPYQYRDMAYPDSWNGFSQSTFDIWLQRAQEYGL